MFRFSGLFFIVLAVVCGTLLFWTSQSVQKEESNLSKVSRNLSQEDESLRVLSAEWDYLNRPQRLEVLANEVVENDMLDKAGMPLVDSVNSIPEPVAPVVPGVKPDRSFRNVSTARSVKARKSSVIQKTDRQAFEKILEENVEGEAP